jgi:phosphopantetheinyl transferase
VWLVGVADEGPLGLHAASALVGDGPASATKRLPQDRRRSIVARGALVRLVAARAEIATEQVSIGEDAAGRPLLGPENGLEVSIAHSGELVACAVSTRRVGVDVERVDRPEADDLLAARICTRAELLGLEAAPERGRRAELVRLWARKEALSKALGIGLALPFERVDVGGPRPLLDGTGAGGWWVQDLAEAPEGYVGALAGEGRHPAIRVSLLGGGH